LVATYIVFSLMIELMLNNVAAVYFILDGNIYV
jgi:hypothetical protein